MTQVGTPSKFQKDYRILVSCIAMYDERPPGLLRLIESCEKFGVQLTLFGEGQHFVNMYESKLQYLGECLYGVRHTYNYVINIDANDSLILRPLDDLLYMLPSISSENKIIFAGEKNCFPFKELENFYDSKDHEYPYINGGGFISHIDTALGAFFYMRGKRLIDRIPEIKNHFTDYYRDDQGAWSYEYTKGNLKGMIYVDSIAKIFQTLCLVNQDDDLLFTSRGLQNKKTSTFPFILHANGSADYTNIYNKIIKNE